MKTIRNSVFETNSSSMHSLTIVSEEEFEKFENCDLLYQQYSENLVPIEEVYNDSMVKLDSADLQEHMSEDYKKIYKTSLTIEKFKEILKSLSYSDLDYSAREDAWANIKDDLTATVASLTEDITTFNCLGDDRYETFVQHYTTKHGEAIVAFGYYGYQG